MRRDEDGTVLLLTLVLSLVLVLATAVVVDASAVFLAHRDLASQADGAALAAAQAVDYEAFYAGEGDVLPLGDVRDVAAAYVAAHFPATTLAAVTTDGETVTVTLERRLALPLAPPGYADGVTVSAAATARLRRR